MSLLVVHLVRQQNGSQPLHRFLDSYVAHEPGIEHELLLALKGFGSESQVRACLAEVRTRGADPRHLTVADDGLDLTAYARIVASVRADRYCFINSYSRVLSDQWLAYLSGALDKPLVELAGATGSWASQRDYRRYHLRLPSGYEGVFDGREATRLAFLSLTRERNPRKRNNGRLAHKAVAGLDLLRDRHAFDPFPAHHLRTNAFVASRKFMLAIGFPRIRSKRDAYRLESGPASFTRRAEDMGRRAVVVGRDGLAYDSEDWDQSATFWQGAQQNLLVADNQTDDYDNGDAERRRMLSQLAWGSKARPA